MSSNPDHTRLEMMTENSAVHQVLPLLFRKIVRLLVGTISFPVLADLLKSLYVEEAKKKLEQSNSKPTKSALALITGLDTRVVSSVLRNNNDQTAVPISANPENSLIDIWNSDESFQDPISKTAAILPIEGKGRTFQTLVLRVIGRNITVKTVLDRLLEGGTVRIIDGDIPRIELISKFYNPISSDNAKATEIGLLEHQEFYQLFYTTWARTTIKGFLSKDAGHIDLIQRITKNFGMKFVNFLKDKLPKEMNYLRGLKNHKYNQVS